MKPRPPFPKNRPGGKYVVLTAYDAPTAALFHRSGVDWLLVGDSVGMVLLGYTDTRPVTMDEMLHHARAVRRGAPEAFVIGDLPLKGVEKGPKQALESAQRFLRDAKLDAVKIEWAPDALAACKLLRDAKIPFMGHVGLTPQKAPDGFKIHGRLAVEAREILRQAEAFEKAGAFAVLLECVPAAVGEAVTGRLRVPTIGIGAGPGCSGQVLVWTDLAGLHLRMEPRFVRRYTDLDPFLAGAVREYADDVKKGRFPSMRESFQMDENERRSFLAQSGVRKPQPAGAKR